nr:Maf family protein [Rubrobacter calidifluminis]
MASASPRRAELLERVGLRFEVRESGFEEVELEDPARTARENARGKALAVSSGEDGAVVLGSDTVVYLPGEGVLGKAEDAVEVLRMLGLLSGRRHEVYTAVAVAGDGELSLAHTVTAVRMRALGRGEIEAYAASGEGVGKAGGYAIQGRAGAFVEWISGDYTAVVGLPLPLTLRMLEKHGLRWY